MDLTLTVQAATITALEALSDPDRQIVVEAWAMPEPTTELCSEDSAHGPGLVQVPIRTATVDGTDTDGHLVFGPSETVTHAQCLACAIRSVETQIEDGMDWISLDVTT